MNKNFWMIDTDVLIDYLRGYPDASVFLESKKDALSVCSITVAELYAGVREGQEKATLDSFIQAFSVVEVDLEIAQKGGLFRRDYGKNHGVGLADALIAAAAASAGAILVTLNRKHYPMLEDVLVPYQKV